MPMHSPPHVGEHIKEELDFLGLSVAQGAEALGISRQQLNRVLTEKSGISVEMAMRLEAVIGSNADHWMRLQTAYDLAQVRQHKADITKGLRRLTPAA